MGKLQAVTEQADGEEARDDDRNTRNLAQVKILKTNEEGSQAKKQGSSEEEEDQKQGTRKKEALNEEEEGTNTEEQENLTGSPERGAQDRDTDRPLKESCQITEESPRNMVKVSLINKEDVQKGIRNQGTILEEMMKKARQRQEAEKLGGRGAKTETRRTKRLTGKPQQEEPRNSIKDVMKMWRERDKKAKEDAETQEQEEGTAQLGEAGFLLIFVNFC